MSVRFVLSWRHIYLALLGAMGLIASLSRYLPNYALLFRVALLCAVLILASRALLWLVASRPDRPFSYAVENFRTISSQVVWRLALFFSAALFFVWLPPFKAQIPKAAGFFADPVLASIDRMLFLGRDPWELAHAVPFMSFIDAAYSLWPPTILAAAAWIALTRGEEVQRRFFLGWALSFWLLGVVGAMALASAGPIFAPHLGYGFDDLHVALAGAEKAMWIRETLWNAYTTDSVMIGGGISAAPSMHCALTFLFALAARGTFLFIPGLLYAAFIWFGSVYLGWHYFIDGAISLAGVAAIWHWTKTLGAKAHAPGREQPVAAA